jgi:hypothetical protein
MPAHVRLLDLKQARWIGKVFVMPQQVTRAPVSTEINLTDTRRQRRLKRQGQNARESKDGPLDNLFHSLTPDAV